MIHYSWKNFSVVILGKKIATLQEMKYKEKSSQEYIWGAGNEPIDIQTGNKEVEGSFTILQAEMILLNNAAKAANTHLHELKFDIAASYNSKGVIVTNIILGCKISDTEYSFKQNDAVMKIELPFKALGLKTGV